MIYKAAKACVELALAAALLSLARGGAPGAVGWLEGAAEHLPPRWSVAASQALHALATERALHVLEGGLSLDGLLTAFEGWSLWRGYRWAPWLVVCATLIPMPWEVWHIARSPSTPRVAIAIANTAVAVYLGMRIARSSSAAR